MTARRGDFYVTHALKTTLEENLAIIIESVAYLKNQGLQVFYDEVSDALAVIVSEETGIISLAVKGFLARELDEDTLVSCLMNALQPKPARSLASLWRRK